MKHVPPGCTKLIELGFLCPLPAEPDYSGVETVPARDFPVYAAAPQMLDALASAVAAFDSGAVANNLRGSNYVEDVLKPQLRAALARARG